MAQETSINGELYSWSNVRLNLLGRNVVGLKGIDYSDSDEIKGVKGRGSMDIGVVIGNYQATGKITLEMTEVEALNKQLPRGQRLSQIPPFDIPICFKNSSNMLITHVLKNCRFMGQGRSGKSGEVKEFEVELALYVGEIDWNA